MSSDQVSVSYGRPSKKGRVIFGELEKFGKVWRTGANEATEIQDGIILEKGSQLNRPVNLDGYWDLRSWLSYGMPLDFMKSKLNLNMGGGVTRRPGQVNDLIGFNNSQRISGGLSINSSIIS